MQELVDASHLCPVTVPADKSVHSQSAPSPTPLPAMVEAPAFSFDQILPQTDGKICQAPIPHIENNFIPKHMQTPSSQHRTTKRVRSPLLNTSKPVICTKESDSFNSTLPSKTPFRVKKQKQNHIFPISLDDINTYTNQPIHSFDDYEFVVLDDNDCC